MSSFTWPPSGGVSSVVGGVGVSATTSNGVVTVASASNLVAVTSSASITLDLSQGQVQAVTLGINSTLNAPTNVQNGETFMLIVTQDSTGGRTLAYNSAFKFPGGTVPTLSTAAGATDLLSFVAESSAFILTVFSGNFH